MPGVVYKKKGGKVFPPDWTQIGYDNTPKSTLIGFDYAVDIKDTWDTSIVTHIERYRDDKVLMYWPKNIDTSNLLSVDRMFQASNLESVDIDLSNAKNAGSVFTDCLNLRNAIVHGLGNPDAPIGVVRAIPNMFSNCRSLVNVDLNLTEYSTPLSAVNLFTDCWELKEFIYDGKSENIARISSLYNAFTNCYKMEKLTVKDDLCEWIGCYAVGSQTEDGCLFNVRIGGTANGSQAAFRKAKIDGGSQIIIANCSNAQDMFREAVINPSRSDDGITIQVISNNAYNASYMFNDAIFRTSPRSYIDIKIKIANGTHCFDGLTFETDSFTKELMFGTSGINLNSCTLCENMFANSNVVSLNGLSNTSLQSATNLSNMFYNSLDLSDNSLSGILNLLMTATSYAGTKSLLAVGFTDSDVYPLSRFQNLPNNIWNTFTAAGWTYN